MTSFDAKRVRRIAASFVVLCAAVAWLSTHATAGEAPTIKVFKSPTCSCCTKWITHLEANGFRVEAENVRDVARIKRENGLPQGLASCHTAFVGGYLIEGHVPAEDILTLLRQKTPIAGLAVPKMPIGSPGMEGPKPVRYDVIAFDGDGKQRVFATHGP